jgi:hypothetical protein
MNLACRLGYMSCLQLLRRSVEFLMLLSEGAQPLSAIPFTIVL